MSSREALLSNLLGALVDEWGQEEVQQTLDRFSRLERHNHKISSKLKGRSIPNQRPSAAIQVQRIDAEGGQRELLLELANKFDCKEFLPSVSDVREFMIMAGERPASMRDRSEAFRLLLDLLLRFSPEQLTQIVEAVSQSGPAQLGPISDAISAAGERLHRRSLG